MKRGILPGLTILGALLLALACSKGQGAKSADDADSEAGGASSTEDEGSWEDVEQKETPKEQKGSRKANSETKTSNSVKDNPTPEFKEGGSVNDAINAVPQGLPRENIELEELNQPLSDVALYEPCKLSPANHFEIKFAVWEGRCVGMDIKTMPKNDKLESCLREIVSKAKWRDKTKSLNISTVQF